MIILDTHVLIWAVNNDPRLGPRTRQLIEAAIQADEVLVSAITPWEIALLCQKGRLSLGRDVGVWIDEALSRPGVRLAPIEPAIALGSVRLPGTFHADPADRFIVATARHLAAQLVTADREILNYADKGYVAAVDAAA